MIEKFDKYDVVHFIDVEERIIEFGDQFISCLKSIGELSDTEEVVYSNEITGNGITIVVIKPEFKTYEFSWKMLEIQYKASDNIQKTNDSLLSTWYVPNTFVREDVEEYLKLKRKFEPEVDKIISTLKEVFLAKYNKESWTSTWELDWDGLEVSTGDEVDEITIKVPLSNVIHGSVEKYVESHKSEI